MVEKLKAEMDAINLWDRMFADNPNPDDIDKDACTARLFRRVQVAAQLHELATRN